MKYLQDKTTKEVLYGGGAGGGKTHLLCNWIIMNCIQYPDTRWLIGRARLNMLYKSTMLEFFRLLNLYGLKNYSKFNNRTNTLQFTNGSMVFLQDLYYYPNDPDMTSLRGYELTGMALDEGAEIPFKAFEILANTRLRYNLTTYNLIPKVLVCSNPTKNWLYSRYYLPHIEGTLPPDRKFVQSLATDNHYLDPSYVKGLKDSSERNRQIYFYGNWEYDDNMTSLFNHEQLVSSFYIETQNNKDKYLTCDVAMSGKDRTVITYWQGLNCLNIDISSNNDTISITKKLKEYINKYKINIHNVIIDRIGVGAGVYDILKGCTGFIANEKPLLNEGFANIKSQLYYKLAELINRQDIYINAPDELKDSICEELEAHQRFNTEKDQKAAVTPKDKVKEHLGKSPDIADALMMRMYYEYRKKGEYTYSILSL